MKTLIVIVALLGFLGIDTNHCELQGKVMAEDYSCVEQSFYD